MTKRQELTSPEEMLLMRSLRDMNLSKLVADDIPLFNGLLADIFPKTTNPPKKTYPEIEKVIPDVVKDFGTIVLLDSFTLKIIQLYETYVVRHGFMMVGPSGTGKTTIMKILTETISRVPTNPAPTRIIRMNPKGITS
jgi:dynein heavy chain